MATWKKELENMKNENASKITNMMQENNKVKSNTINITVNEILKEFQDLIN